MRSEERVFENELVALGLGLPGENLPLSEPAASAYGSPTDSYGDVAESFAIGSTFQ